MNTYKGKNRKSFTLIELLVIIAVIGLLSSIVLVNLRGSRNKAKIAKTLEFSQSVQHAIGNEAVGIWNFDEGSGTTAQDISGYGNNGTIYGGASFTEDTPYKVMGSGQGKYALSFDGVNDYISLPNNTFSSLSQGTIAAWIYPTGSGAQQTIFECSYGGSANMIYFELENGKPHWAVFASGAWRPDGYSKSVLSNNQWHFVVVTVDASGWKIYVDGIYDGILYGDPAANKFFNNISVPQVNKIGTAYNGARFMKGSIDDVRIYATALTLSEIQQLYLVGLEKHQQLTMD